MNSSFGFLVKFLNFSQNIGLFMDNLVTNCQELHG
jgi:hypothetical protein